MCGIWPRRNPHRRVPCVVCQAGDARNKLLDGIGCARGGQIIGGCERHLLTARNDRGRGEDGEGKIRMLLRQHGGDPCAFRFGVDAGFRSAHARPFSQDFQRFRIVVRAGHVVAVQHGVVVEPLVRHESGDAGRRHRVRHVAERLRRFAGARTVQEQACGRSAGASSGSRTMAFTVLPPSNATVICVSLVRYAPPAGF